MPDVVRVEREGAVALVTIDHPPVNAISRAVVDGLRDVLFDLGDQVRVAIVTGSGRFFAAGADISEFGQTGSGEIAGAQPLTLEMERSPVVTIAAVNGIAYGGGCELAMACDVRIASTTARFGQPEINLGIIPGWGGTQRLPRLIGRSAAMLMLLTGDPIDAETALRYGLVSQVVEPEGLLGAARELADRLAGKAPMAVAATKRAVAAGLDRPLTDGMEAERQEFVGVFGTEDAAEGIRAFLEKRKPEWTGR